VHQWAKNLLLFVPAFASFKFFQLGSSVLTSLVLAFAAFNLVASAIYVLNDFRDLANDRVHSVKKHRPMASGAISVPAGLTVSAIFLVAGLILGYVVGFTFFLTLLVYLALTTAYSFGLKRVALVDCITLAGLYTLRVVAGGFASGIELSFWLLAFSVFFFLSLAWVKRYAELDSVQRSGNSLAGGRGYLVTDLPLILNFGAASGLIAVMIFALYLDSTNIRTQYAVPQIGWLAIPFLMYLIGRMWFKAFRGSMNEDPVLFLFRDWSSIVTVVLMGASLVAAHIGVRL
jgi:4-hydroxybenzoate polyprenyltransferase